MTKKSTVLSPESPKETFQDHVKWIRNIIREKFGINPSKVELYDEIPWNFTPQDNRWHSRWGGAEERYDNMYWYSPEKWLVPLDIKTEYSFSNNGTPYHEDGETFSTYLNREKPDFLFYINKYHGKAYGENWELYGDINVYKSPNFKEKRSNMESNKNKKNLLTESLWNITICTNKDLNNTLQLEPIPKVRNIIERILGKHNIHFCWEMDFTFVPQDNNWHSRWGGAEEHYDNMYWWSPKTWLVPLNVVKEYSFSDNGTLYHTDGETMLDFFEKDGRQFQYYVNVYSGKEYGEDWELYEGIDLYQSPDFPKKLSEKEKKSTNVGNHG